MKTIALSFSLKGQSLEAIIEKLKEIRQKVGPAIAIHGNLPTTELIKRNKSNELNVALTELFPIQLNLWDGRALRKEMAECAKKLDADIFIIGTIETEGVAAEIKQYQKQRMLINYIPL